MLSRAVLMMALTSCYGPSPPAGAPCESSKQCPSPQYCVSGACSLYGGGALPINAPESPRLDAPPEPPDAPPQPPIDAAPLACTTTGLSCNGTATTFTCGGHCWVLCTGGAARDAASASCTGWMGALGEIDDADEQSCVAAQINAVAWLGLVQDGTATTPASGWTWNGTAPLTYTHWQSGVPNDRDGNENGEEQCAKIQTDGTWDDVACSSAIDFLCERP